jgi:hypothetical protein
MSENKQNKDEIKDLRANLFAKMQENNVKLLESIGSKLQENNVKLLENIDLIFQEISVKFQENSVKMQESFKSRNDTILENVNFYSVDFKKISSLIMPNLLRKLSLTMKICRLKLSRMTKYRKRA